MEHYIRDQYVAQMVRNTCEKPLSLKKILNKINMM